MRHETHLAASSLPKATAEANLRGVSDLNIDIIPVDMRELEGNSTNTTAGGVESNSTNATATNATATFTIDGEMICHPYDLDWDDLTNDQQKAVRALSFNSNTWDDDTAKDPVEIRNDYWIDAPNGETELTNKERKAAIFLGWNEGSWDDFYSDYDWDELPKERSSDEKNVKAAAKALGYNEDAWDNDEEVPTDSLPWANLTATEQEAAAVLGYDECLWDREILVDETAGTDARH